MAAAAHPTELTKRDNAYLCIDHLTMGVGGTSLPPSAVSHDPQFPPPPKELTGATCAGDDSWSGLTVLPQYWVKPAPLYVFGLRFVPFLAPPPARTRTSAPNKGEEGEAHQRRRRRIMTQTWRTAGRA